MEQGTVPAISSPPTTTTMPTSLLVILSSSPHEPQFVSHDTMLLGLSLLRRNILTASRSGINHILVAAAHPAEVQPQLHDTIATVLSSSSPMVPPAGRLILLAGNVLTSQEWIKALIKMPLTPETLYCDGTLVAIIDSADMNRLLSLISLGCNPSDLFTLLGQSFNVIPQRLAPEGRLLLDSLEDIQKAESWLLRSLVKSSESFMSRHVERLISLAISRRLVWTSLSPNAMTVISLAIGLMSAPFFLSSQPEIQLIGGILFLAHSILDGCDGELARLKFQESRWGGLLDFWGDNLVHITIFFCMGLGWSMNLQSSWPLWLSVAAIAGTLGSAWSVYRQMMPPKLGTDPLFTSVVRSTTTRLSQIMDALGRRDFIYLVLLLSAFGKASWFLVPTAIGAPIFCVILLWLSHQESYSQKEKS
jgi:phosphatidylglycerophosphate synthase